jgi:hypothetical protein
MLINVVDMNIKLTSTPEVFHLWGPYDDPRVHIKILGATLFVTQIELKPPFLLAHAVLGMKKCRAHYSNTYIKTFTASSEAQQLSIDNASLGQIPERILTAMVKNTAFVGSANTNHFHFHNFDMTNCVL